MDADAANVNRWVFLSHSSLDADDVKEARGALEAASVKCWMAPDDIPGSTDYADAIAAAIDGASLFALFLSERSTQSDNVRNELELAHNNKVGILPIRLDHSPLPGGFRLHVSRRQWVDVGASEPRWNALVREVVRLTGGESLPALPPPCPRPLRRPLATAGVAAVAMTVLVAFFWSDGGDLDGAVLDREASVDPASSTDRSATSVLVLGPDTETPPDSSAASSTPQAPTSQKTGSGPSPKPNLAPSVSEEKPSSGGNRSIVMGPMRNQKKQPGVKPLNPCNEGHMKIVACKLRRSPAFAGASLPMTAKVSQADATGKVKFELGTAKPIVKPLKCRVQQLLDIGLAQCP